MEFSDKLYMRVNDDCKVVVDALLTLKEKYHGNNRNTTFDRWRSSTRHRSFEEARRDVI